MTPITEDFINDDLLHGLLDVKPTQERFQEVIDKSMAKQALTVEECAVLINASAPEQIEQIKEAARELKRRVYGNRIVLFAPLYVGNYCQNDCVYCGFRKSNTAAVRRTLTHDELRGEVEALEDMGHKRLILVYGEAYSAKWIAETVQTVYDFKKGHGEIRRVNINAAPMSIDDYRTVKQAHIGTYQIFQETYHKETYAKVHPGGTRKGDYLWRLHGLGRAMEAGIDDVGIGALYGLYDWRFETLGLISHALHLQKHYGVGPHTISFPRLQPASGVNIDQKWFVNDDEFKRLVAILRLSVPYTGMIMTARESPEVRREVLGFGVSQIDAGTRLEIGGYSEGKPHQELEKEQFAVGDARSLDSVTRELLRDGFIPSFCTACYRLGRTGETFMEFAIPGFIEQFCTPNALTTLQEYLIDYASPETRQVGEKTIDSELTKMPEGVLKDKAARDLRKIREENARDMYS
ncbi:MAG: [FeFe] hydrogenase H-cluster radical SAM maturase HydG [Capsulimonadaceae bacterium]|nr:[FeFe] hydrogenase H-cluster radical SAM maturase HydG [Capsulimonadaceae bacterium]